MTGLGPPMSKSRAVSPVLWTVLVWVLVWDLFVMRRPLMVFTSSDFATFYGTGRAWLDGADLYRAGPNLNPPIATILFVPFAVFPQRPAMLAWLACNLLGIAFSVRLITRELALDDSLHATLTRLAWIGALMPTIQILSAANLAGILMWPATLAWREARRGRDLRAGLWLGFVFALKPNFMMFVPYWLLRRRWRSTAGSLLVCTISGWTGWLLFGTEAYQSWIASVRSIAWFGHFGNASMMGIIANTAPESWRGRIWMVAVAAVVLAVIYALRHDSGDVDREWAVVWIGALLIAPLGWSHYYALAAGPLAAACRTPSRYLLVTAVALCVPPPLLYALAPNVPVVTWFASCLAGFATLALFYLLVRRPSQMVRQR
jgi:hypothetical protein